MKYQPNIHPFTGLKIVATFAIALSATPTSSLAGNKNENPTVVPHTPGTADPYSELSAAWRQWQYGIIADTGLNPFGDDPTGALCDLNQSGRIPCSITSWSPGSSSGKLMK